MEEVRGSIPLSSTFRFSGLSRRAESCTVWPLVSSVAAGEDATHEGTLRPMSGVSDLLSNNLWRLPYLGFAIVLIVFGTAKKKLFPRVAQRVVTTGVIELMVSLLSWAAWESFIRNSYDSGRWAFGLFNAALSLVGLAGYITLLTAVFLDRVPTQSHTKPFGPSALNPQLMSQPMMNPPLMDQPPPVAPPWPFQPPQ
jgi:hypothetical protein